MAKQAPPDRKKLEKMTADVFSCIKKRGASAQMYSYYKTMHDGWIAMGYSYDTIWTARRKYTEVYNALRLMKNDAKRKQRQEKKRISDIVKSQEEKELEEESRQKEEIRQTLLSYVEDKTRDMTEADALESLRDGIEEIEPHRVGFDRDFSGILSE